MKAQITARSYILEVTPEVWKFINVQDEHGIELNSEDVIKNLNNLSAYNIDWSGHFGMAIYFSLDENDNDNLLNIEKYINNLKL